MYLFGGNDGSRALNDVYFLDLEKLHWNSVQVHVSHVQGVCLFSKLLSDQWSEK